MGPGPHTALACLAEPGRLGEWCVLVLHPYLLPRVGSNWTPTVLPSRVTCHVRTTSGRGWYVRTRQARPLLASAQGFGQEGVEVRASGDLPYMYTCTRLLTAGFASTLSTTELSAEKQPVFKAGSAGSCADVQSPAPRSNRAARGCSRPSAGWLQPQTTAVTQQRHARRAEHASGQRSKRASADGWRLKSRPALGSERLFVK